MEEILYKAASYLLLIALGVLLKRVGYFKENDFRTLAKVLLNVTLPCAIIYNFSNIAFEVSLLSVTVFSLFCGVLAVVLVVALDKAFGLKRFLPFDIINLSGYNIGNFCLPFAQSFLPPLGVLGISLFDAGNALFCNGGAKAIATVYKHHLNDDGAEKESIFKQLLGSLQMILSVLSRSVPFLSYVIMVVLSVIGISLPKIVVSVASIGSAANPFVAMLMIGVGFKLKIKKDGMAHIVRIIITRYIFTIALAAIIFRVLPYALEIRQALVLALLSPIASAAPAYTESMEEDFELSSTINSISMLISIALITLSLLVLL